VACFLPPERIKFAITFDMVMPNKVRTKSGLLFTAGKELSLTLLRHGNAKQSTNKRRLAFCRRKRIKFDITLDMVVSNKVRTKSGLLFAAGKELSLTLP